MNALDQAAPAAGAAQRAGTSATPLKGKRILVAKPGLDGHDIGAKVIALALRDAGASVIYTGLRKSPDYIVRVAVDEDVDAVGLSILSGSHNELVARTVALLAQSGAGDIPVFVGGTIPADDRAAFLRAGIRGVFTSDMPLDDVIDAVAKVLR
ncbi:cobalamin B12-binding domain-containing protein [Paraburkholderia unamae]|uniref:Methylmalonyl-CoA mutase C-terminal domain/subunit n=1 Tax=Paraburkholderia unamae TaxID=219649 RepID=A0ABX5KLW3_9BURK|nr:cobalamin B12-binding domain-containing protein [Paraburkholderia unamae]PVX81633.1 methylmalonyl-CoA mutase C-terminal domain/subunit [Paraburkholderia unamae]RAR62653.1 methylmalonyl-CoA mutase C-terminal domain/subunit [Paraburkholderia unamae]